MTVTSFSFPTAIRFGPGARHELSGAVSRAGVGRPLVVTDSGIAGLGFFGELIAALEAEGLSVLAFSGVHGNPHLGQVNAGAAAFRAHGADSLVGIGGGAALDVTKAIGVAVSHDAPLLAFEDGRADAEPIDRIPWFTAVPTTAGTGSEVGRAAVIADEAGTKHILFSPALLARSVFADPELTVGLPPDVTAATGMDALAHNVEAYLADGFNPMCDGIALEGTRLCAEAIPRAVAAGDDLDARSSMLMASMMGAVAFQKGLGPVHSCAHALGTVYDIHHGLANALVIDQALRLDLPEAAPRLGRLAEAAGVGSTAEDFLDWLADLKAEIGIPATLSDAGLDPGRVEALAAAAAADPCHHDGPTSVTEADFRETFTAEFRS